MRVRQLLPQTRTDVLLTLASMVVEASLIGLWLRKHFYPRSG